MRIVGLLSILWVTSIAVCLPAQAGFIDGNELVSWMREHEKVDHPGGNPDFIESARYAAYVAAVFDVTNDVLFNAPDRITVGQACAVVSKFLKGHPERWTENADDLVVEAFQRAYPLKEETSITPAENVPREFVRPPTATSIVTGRRGTYGVWYDSAIWTVSTKPTNPDAEYEFSVKSGDAYGMVISERIAVPIETLRDVALENITDLDPNAQIRAEAVHMINDTPMLCTVTFADIERIPIVYQHCFYSGPSGSIQVITYTSQNLLSEYGAVLDELNNGFVAFE